MSLHIAHLRIFSRVLFPFVESNTDWKKFKHQHNDFFFDFINLKFCNFIFGESISFELYIESESTRSNENNFCFVQNRLLTWFFSYCLKKLLNWKWKWTCFRQAPKFEVKIGKITCLEFFWCELQWYCEEWKIDFVTRWNSSEFGAFSNATFQHFNISFRYYQLRSIFVQVVICGKIIYVQKKNMKKFSFILCHQIRKFSWEQ